MATGLGPKKFGTGTVKPSGIDQWQEGTRQRTEVQSVNVKPIQLAAVSFEAGNPRTLNITADDIRTHRDTLTLPPAALDPLGTDTWSEDYRTLAEKTFNDRAKLDDFMSIAYFAASLRSAKRLINPITVWQDGTTFFKITGERRFLAHLLLGEKDIVARIYQHKPSDLDIRQIQRDENEQRESLSLRDTLINLEQLIEAWKAQTGKSDITAAQFQPLCGKSYAQTARYLAIIKHGTPALRKAITAERITSMRVAYEYSALAQSNPNDSDLALKQQLTSSGPSPEELARQNATAGQAIKRRRKPASVQGPKPTFLHPQFIKRSDQRSVAAAAMIARIVAHGLNDVHLEAAIQSADLSNQKALNDVFTQLFQAALAKSGSGQTKS